MSKVTIYKSMTAKTPHHITVGQALNRIRSGKSKELIEK